MEQIACNFHSSYRKTLFYVFLLLICLFPSSAFCEDADKEVHLDADKVTYAEDTGIATADGNVKITNQDIRLFAPYVEYNGNDEVIEAFSDARNNITLFSGANKLTGKHMTYNLATKRGVLTQASGQMEAFYFKGKDVRVMPMEDAVKQGIITLNVKKKEKASTEDMVAEWLDVTTTTCNFENPHYHFVSKKIIFVPGKKVIIKQPGVYIGKTHVFTYPFDYILSLSQHSDQSVMPFFDYDSDKGVGAGIKGIVDLGDFGEADIAAMYWTKDIFEAKLRYQREMLEGLFIFAETDRFYNEDDNETLWRPKWGIEYSRPDGWKASLYESQRELVKTEMKAGKEVRYNVWRSPEFNFYSPWYGDQASGGKFRVFGIYGRYQDNMETSNPWITRLALGAELNGSPEMGASVIKPYYGARYTHYDYESGEETQEVTDGWVGFEWSIGVFSFDSYYFRRWVNGASMMSWDEYEEREDICQTVSFPLPFGASWEKWKFYVRADYDNISNELAEIVYMLNYTKHCMTWQLWAKDDRSDDKLSVGLTFYIEAYPEMTVGSKPYDRPINEDQRMGTIDVPNKEIR